MILKDIKHKLTLGQRVKFNDGDEALITRICDKGVVIGNNFVLLGDDLDLNLTPSWDNLYPGCYLEGVDGNKAKILAVTGDVFLRSDRIDEDQIYGWNTIKQAKREGWKVVSDEPDTIEILGKKYAKEDVQERIKELKEIIN